MRSRWALAPLTIALCALPLQAHAAEAQAPGPDRSVRDPGMGPAAPEAYSFDQDVQIDTALAPTLILHQNTSGGNPARTWWLRGTHSSFAVWDGMNVPFEVDASVPSNSLVVRSGGGNVGLGLPFPASALHLYRSNGNARLTVEEGSGTMAERVLLRLKNRGKTRFVMENTWTGTTWTFDNSAVGFTISKVGDGVNEFVLDETGNLTIQGMLTQLSDRNAKREIEPVDAEALLARVAALPVSSWRYQGEGQAARHMGPMAQDFSAAFGLGADDRHLAPGDVAGVALAAIQALKRQADEKDARLRALEERLAALEGSQR